jgi:molybdopterin synthase catalytic subunit
VDVTESPDATCSPEWEPHLSISASAVNREASAPGGSAFGAEVEFLGVVRGLEDGQPIDGIHYSAYFPMAERHLNSIAERGRRRFGAHPLTIHHVVGFVAAGEPSLLIRLALPHSREAFEALSWYLAELKTALPVWKEIVPPRGRVVIDG